MASQISTQGLVNKCKRYITTDFKDRPLELLIREAIIQADREIRSCDSLYPLAWDIVPYDELRTVYSASISAITQADPGVITAQSADSDITGHGFHNHATIRDIVTIDGVGGMESLNERVFLLEYVDATTFSLKTLDGLDDVNTSSYTAYSSGGSIYHSGFVLNSTTMLVNVASEWTIKGFLPNVTFDGYPSTPIPESSVRDKKYMASSRDWVDGWWTSRPKKHRFWENMTAASTSSHYLFWYPPAGEPYNVSLQYQKEVPDISTWNTSTYPFHPAEVHDAIWHGALAFLVANNKRAQRSSDRVIATQLEVLFTQTWLGIWEKDKQRIRRLSRKMLGSSGGMGGFSA